MFSSLCTPALPVGAGMLKIALTLPGSTRRSSPIESTILSQLKECHEVLVMVSNSLLLCLSVTNNDEVIGTTSTCSIPPFSLRILCWNNSGADRIPKGKHFHWQWPNGMPETMPETVSDIKSHEHLVSLQMGCYVLYGCKRVVFSLNSLVQVLLIETQPRGNWPMVLVLLQGWQCLVPSYNLALL